MPERSLVQRLLDQQNALAEFGSYAFRTHDLPAVLDRAAAVLAKSVGSLCKVCRYRPEENDLILEAGYGWEPGVIGAAISTADVTSPGGRCFITRQPVVCPDLRQADFVLPEFYAHHAIMATVNVLIPGNNGNIPYGILELDSITPQNYDALTINFLTGFANVMAEAVETQKRLAALQNAVAEKDMLARELQHRVRNNLHLINSMLDAEVMSNDGSAVDRFNDIANRVRALATMYDHLLGTGMGRSLAIDEYLDRLCATLRNLQPPKVELRQRPMARVTVDLDTATILGIAITEIITNSFKHAFPTGEGAIEVAVENHTTPRIEVVDNGVGIDLQQAQASKRYGLGLVHRLVEQINGKLLIRPRESGGTYCEIQLPQ